MPIKIDANQVREMNTTFGAGLLCFVFGLLAFASWAAAAIPEHQAIQSWEGTATCLQCHETEAKQMFGSVHYQWLGKTPYMTDGPDLQGKLDMGVNSYCINTLGNWNGCGSCHVGQGARPEPVESQAQLENIDCMICHQEDYKRVRVEGLFVPDTAKMTISMVEAAQTVHTPNRATCLQCHAKGGGGDNFKRGDMALAHVATSDRNFDVHMAVSGGDLNCQSCHVTSEHQIAGRGSDLRPTELDVEMSCTDCHTEKATGGHSNQALNRHVARVACQTCHIGTYARNAADTPATEATEVHRDWREPHVTASGAIHPTPTMANNLTPRYDWWDGRSASYLLYEDAAVDPFTGSIPTSRPVGDIDGAGAKLYPFKYKTATQPLLDNYNQLIAIDTSVYFTTGDVDAATKAGIANMGYPATEPYSWVQTDTMQLITHEVMPQSAALDCTSCHNSTARMDLQGELGFGLKDTHQVVCAQCHGNKGSKDGPEYLWVHDKHVREKKYDCGWCHDFTRPERSLRLAPFVAKLKDVVSVLRVMIGDTAPLAAGLPDVDGDGRIGMREAIDMIREISSR